MPFNYGRASSIQNPGFPIHLEVLSFLQAHFHTAWLKGDIHIATWGLQDLLGQGHANYSVGTLSGENLQPPIIRAYLSSHGLAAVQ